MGTILDSAAIAGGQNVAAPLHCTARTGSELRRLSRGGRKFPTGAGPKLGLEGQLRWRRRPCGLQKTISGVQGVPTCTECWGQETSPPGCESQVLREPSLPSKNVWKEGVSEGARAGTRLCLKGDDRRNGAAGMGRAGKIGVVEIRDSGLR